MKTAEDFAKQLWLSMNKTTMVTMRDEEWEAIIEELRSKHRDECAHIRAENAQLRESLKAQVKISSAENAKLRARVDEADDLIYRASCLDGPTGDRHLSADATEYRTKYGAPPADSPVLSTPTPVDPPLPALSREDARIARERINPTPRDPEADSPAKFTKHDADALAEILDAPAMICNVCDGTGCLTCEPDESRCGVCNSAMAGAPGCCSKSCADKMASASSVAAEPVREARILCNGCNSFHSASGPCTTPRRDPIAPVWAYLEELEADAVRDRFTQQQVSEALQAKVTALEARLAESHDYLLSHVDGLLERVTSLENGMHMHSDCIGKLSEWAKTREKSPFREHPAAPPAPVAESAPKRFMHLAPCGERIYGDDETGVNGALKRHIDQHCGLCKPETAGPGHAFNDGGRNQDSTCALCGKPRHWTVHAKGPAR